MKVMKRFWDETGKCFGDVEDSRSKEMEANIGRDIKRNLE
jgi:hypothetical protein